MLEVLAETRHPVTITTKSDRVLATSTSSTAMAADRLAGVALSVTSLTPEIARTLEPRAPAPRKRLAAVKALSEAGVPAWVAIAPVVPGITDHELERIVEAAAEAGAQGVFYLPVRLPFEVAPLFRAWLDEHFPDRAGKVMHIIQTLRGGKDNDPNWFSRMRGSGPWADLLKARFDRAVRKHGLNVDKRPLQHATCSSRRRGRNCGCSSREWDTYFGQSTCPQVGKAGRGAARFSGSGGERFGRAPAEAKQAGAGHAAVRQRQGGLAEGAFGEQPADDPLAAAAARTMVALVRPVDDMVAAPHRIMGEDAAADGLDVGRHGLSPVEGALEPAAMRRARRSTNRAGPATKRPRRR